MEKWRKSIIFNQTRGGWRRWLPHTWHSCRTEAPGQLHPTIVIVVIIIVVIVVVIIVVFVIVIIVVIVVVIIVVIVVLNAPVCLFVCRLNG